MSQPATAATAAAVAAARQQQANSQGGDDAGKGSKQALQEWFDELEESSSDDHNSCIDIDSDDDYAGAEDNRDGKGSQGQVLGLVPSKFQTPCPLASVGPIHPCDAPEEAEEAAFGGVWVPPVIQLLSAVPVTPAGPPVPQVAPAPALGFTEAQKETLRCQILAFKKLKSGERITPDEWKGTEPAELPAYVTAGVGGGPAAAPTAAEAAARRDREAALRREAALDKQKQQAAKAQAALLKQQRADQAAQRKAKQLKMAALKQADVVRSNEAKQIEARARHERADAISKHRGVLRPWRGPLYTLAGSSRERPLENFELAVDISTVIHGEAQRLLGRCKHHVQEYVTNAVAGRNGMKKVTGSERADLMLRLRKLHVLGLQTKVRALVEHEQDEIMRLNDRLYKKFQTETRRYLANCDKAAQSKFVELWSARLIGVKDFRNNLSQIATQQKEMRTLNNRAVLRWHERQNRDLSKQRTNDRERRMEALKANDMEAYQSMLRDNKSQEQDERYKEIDTFLTETEEYLNKLTAKVASVKVQKEAEQAYEAALQDARNSGHTDEAAVAIAQQAAKEATASSDLIRKSNNMAGDAQARYYALAHSIDEAVQQPRMLKGPNNAMLREYQMVGLQWMVSLYNNHLNGILADEMGLGKTVQVMALVAYLMENKSNYGPHLIIVPNAVIVNWKSELGLWLPDVKCVYYTGSKDVRSALYKEHVEAIQFNCLVTTYELVMRDASKLARIEWKYCIIDEAQRMKDRESKLARDLDKFNCHRRLLLTGTPLQNELRELWSLLNLLLPELFDDKKLFGRWFSDALQKVGGDQSNEDAMMQKEKRVVVIHRLHQILEPFMLRRQVENVEGCLPPKIAVTLKCPMTPYQGLIYDWVKSTGTKRMDPAGEFMRRYKKTHVALQNKVMELRKICNHPLLTYQPGEDSGLPLSSWTPDHRIVSECGKMHFLDRLLVKFFKTGHRVLLFSTMTKQLDLMEKYLQWRLVDGKRMQYRRIDGGTSLESREMSIQEFNAKGSEVFIFLLSIRAAGRGLNLQSADTVVIYDPDANPKNEEQAIARSHRIGQTKEVRVIHLEAVADAPPDAITQEDQTELVVAEGAAAGPSGAAGGAALAPPTSRNTKKYLDSVESIYRHVIQKLKNEMASEIIDAGRFDQRTTMDERKETLETMLADEERSRIAKNECPTWEWIHQCLARTPQEVEEFERIDREFEWVSPISEEECPLWIRYTPDDAARVLAYNSKPKRGQPKLGDKAQEEEHLRALAMMESQATGVAVEDYVKTPEAVTATGRRQRKAGMAANALIQEHVHWATHNPYRSGGAAPGSAPGEVAADDSEGAPGPSQGRKAWENGAPGGSGGPLLQAGGQSAATVSRSISTMSALDRKADDDDEEEGPLQDEADMEEEKEEDNVILEEDPEDEDNEPAARNPSVAAETTPGLKRSSSNHNGVEDGQPDAKRPKGDQPANDDDTAGVV